MDLNCLGLKIIFIAGELLPSSFPINVVRPESLPTLSLQSEKENNIHDFDSFSIC